MILRILDDLSLRFLRWRRCATIFDAKIEDVAFYGNGKSIVTMIVEQGNLYGIAAVRRSKRVVRVTMQYKESYPIENEPSLNLGGVWLEKQ